MADLLPSDLKKMEEALQRAGVHGPYYAVASDRVFEIYPRRLPGESFTQYVKRNPRAPKIG